MSLNILNTLSAEEYDRRLKDFIKSVEGEYVDVYVDYTGKDTNGNLLRGNPTIGWGFALNNDFSTTSGGPRNLRALNYFLSTVMGVNPTRSTLSTVAIEREKYWQSELKRVLNSYWASDNTKDQTGSSIALQNALNAVLQNRAADIATNNYSANDRLLIGSPRTEFQYENTGEVEATFDAFKQDKEKRLNDVFGANSPVLSNERIALYSMAYQGTLTGKTKEALVSALKLPNSKDAHAEAWFAIRYLRTKEAWRGYMESALFGLYENNSNVQIADAQAAYRMFTLHRKTILDYETKNQAAITSANQTIKNSGMGGIYGVPTIETALNLAKTALLADLRVRHPEIADKLTDSIVSTNIYLNPAKPTDTDQRSLLDARDYETETTGADDLMIGMGQRDMMYGGKGNDILLGEAGNDFLEGGKGNDILVGGAGDDDYYFSSGDGNDKIIDNEGENVIIWADANNKARVMKTFYKSGDAEWKSPDGTAQVNKNSPYKIVLPDGGIIELGEDISSFGINLLDTPAAPTIDNDITGSSDADNIDDTTADDRIETGSGDDTIVADQGGDDQILGGEGRDAISAGYGSDIAEGGSESDILFGGMGDDQVFGENQGNMETLITNGETAQSINEKGDLVAGNDGNDLVYGTNRKDALFGGEGHDLLVGGGGDDAILGDTDATLANIDWSFTVANNQVNFSNVSLDQGATGGDDTIYAGTGNDIVYAGKGDDEIDAGEGNDIVFGEGGDNFITGGGGDDYLSGAGPWVALDEQGNNYIDGGAGNDMLYGETGNDTYRFGRGSGADVIQDYDTTAGNTDTVELNADVLPSDITVTRDYNHLNLKINGTSDSLQLQFFFNNPDSYKVEKVKFADGTIWDIAMLKEKARYINGTDAGETLIGFDDANDIMDGRGGNDNIYGYNGNDVLNGGTGNDTLGGGTGNDTLDGGTGNDMLYGETGNDTYRFGRGSGADVIQDYDTTAGNTDTVEFGEGISSADLEFIKEGFHLRVNIKNTTDTLLIQNYFFSTGYLIEQFKFSDGTVLKLDGVDAIGYKLYGTVGNNQLSGTNNKDEIYGSGGSDTLVGNGGNDILDGGAEDDILQGGSGGDKLTGGTGNDVLIGGAGSDTYVFNIGDGVDTIQDTATDAEGNLILFGEGITRDTFRLIQEGDVLTINIGENGDALRVLNFNPDNPNIRTVEFANGTQVPLRDLLDPSTEGDDIINTGAGNDVIRAKGGNDIVNTNGGNDTIDGGSGDDIINAGEGTDTITGGVGNDILNGGSGNDTYIFNIGDGIDTIDDAALTGEGNTILFGEGIAANDLKLSYENNTLIIKTGTNGDELRLSGFDPNDALGAHATETFQFADGTTLSYSQLIDKGFDLTGTTGDNTINGTNVTDRILALEGNDAISSGDGDDVIDAGSGDDTIYAGNGSDTIMAGKGNDTIDSGEGADAMAGNAGDDTYIVDNAGDFVTENINEGTDLVQSSITYTLTDNVENLTLTETTNISGTGNELNNIIIGNSGNNVLDGGAGTDTLIGGQGNDRYIVGNDSDTVIEQDAQGIDAVWSSISYILGNNLENLTLTGTDNINGTGNDLDNILNGNAGSNILDGAQGADTMMAGAGNDTYIIDNAGDIITENADEGIDTVYSGVDYTLTNNVENLILTGDAISGTGNELNNIITGNSAANILNGGLGNDTIDGGSGDDTINAGDGADILTGGAGNDILNGGAGDDVYTYNIGDGLDTLGDTSGIDTFSMGTGIDFDHTIIRIENTVAHMRLLDAEENETNEGIDITLNPDGSIPVETVSFADGNSFNMRNLVIESKTFSGTNKGETIQTGRHDDTIYAYNGIDTVYAGLSNDTVYGENGNDMLYGESGNDILYGENGNDTLNGGNGKDVLYGGNGDDVLIGGKGDDTLYGESGSDIYIFNRGDGQDIISDTGGDSDSVRLNVNPLDLIFSRSGNDLVLKIADSPTDQMTVKDWYSGVTNQTELFQASDGSRLLNNQVEQLVQAMATFSADNGMAWTEAIQQKPQEAQQVLAQYWEKAA